MTDSIPRDDRPNSPALIFPLGKALQRMENEKPLFYPPRNFSRARFFRLPPQKLQHSRFKSGAERREKFQVLGLCESKILNKSRTSGRRPNLCFGNILQAFGAALFDDSGSCGIGPSPAPIGGDWRELMAPHELSSNWKELAGIGPRLLQG